jgi:outer membrane receptor for monomeric catechols
VYSEGCRLGGLNADGPSGATGEKDVNFDSDILRNYELGTKLNVFDGRAFADMTVYFEDWKNVQTDEIAGDGAFYIVNAGRVRDPGAELDFGATPIENLDLQANFFWNNSSLSRDNSLIAGGDSSLPGAPSASAAVSADYRFAIDSDMGGFVRLRNAYVGSSHLGFSESTPSMGNYDLASLRVGVSRDAWQITAFADNLLDSRGNTFAFGNPFNPAKQVTPPRPPTIGFTLSWSQ